MAANIDTVADIALNGAKFARVENAHRCGRRGVCDVTCLLQGARATFRWTSHAACVRARPRVRVCLRSVNTHTRVKKTLHTTTRACTSQQHPHTPHPPPLPHSQYRLPVKELLKEGTNTLTITILPAINETIARKAAYPYDEPALTARVCRGGLRGGGSCLFCLFNLARAAVKPLRIPCTRTRVARTCMRGRHWLCLTASCVQGPTAAPSCAHARTHSQP